MVSVRAGKGERLRQATNRHTYICCLFVLSHRVFHTRLPGVCSGGGRGYPPETLTGLTRNPLNYTQQDLNPGHPAHGASALPPELLRPVKQRNPLLFYSQRGILYCIHTYMHAHTPLRRIPPGLPAAGGGVLASEAIGSTHIYIYIYIYT